MSLAITRSTCEGSGRNIFYGNFDEGRRIIETALSDRFRIS